MKTRYRVKLVSATLLALIFSCSDNDILSPVVEEESAETPIIIESPRLEYVTSDDIPEIMEALLARTGKSTSFEQSGKLRYNDVDVELESIMRVKDEEKGTSYTYGLFVKDAPDHIYNLIYQKDEKGRILEPYVIGYEMDKNDMDAFLRYGDDFRKFKATYRYYAFDRFFEDSKHGRVGKNGDCDSGNVGGSTNGPPTQPGETFTHSYGGTSVSSTFGYQTGIVPYSYAVSIHSNGQVSTASTVATSGVVTISTTGPTTTGAQSYVLPGTVQESVTIDSQPSGGPGTPCLKKTSIYDSGIIEFNDCINNNNPQQKTPRRVAKTDCPYGDGTVAINTAAKPVRKVNAILNGALSAGQIDWLSDNIATAQAMVQYYLNNGFSQEAEDEVRVMAHAGPSGSLLSAAPFVKYPDDKAAQYANDYPRLTEYLRNQLPTVASIPKITNAIHHFTQLPLSQIQNDLKWDNGPIVEIVQLDHYDSGKTDELTAGYFDKDRPDRILLDVDYVNDVENETTDPDAMIFWIGTTILHEYVHYGNYVTGFQFLGEDGRLFEAKVYGENVQPDRARIVLDRNQ